MLGHLSWAAAGRDIGRRRAAAGRPATAEVGVCAESAGSVPDAGRTALHFGSLVKRSVVIGCVPLYTFRVGLCNHPRGETFSQTEIHRAPPRHGRCRGSPGLTCPSREREAENVE